MLSRPSSFLAQVFTLLCLSVVLTLACSCDRQIGGAPDPAPSVYYWRQKLRLSEVERTFIDEQRVGKVYLHLFDVIRRQGALSPSTTLEFSDTLPSHVQIIPTIFLANDVMNDTTGLSALPQLIARRVREMLVQNDLPAPNELQIDFDWTRRNQARYFDFLKALRKAWNEKGGTIMSTTIRLHQLGMEAPPVDYGVLMVYNVGNLADSDEENSILTEEGIRPYLRPLPDYPLPLCAALPIYSWNLLFHDHRLTCILRGVDISDTTRFKPIDATHYLSVDYQPIPPNGVMMRGEGRIFPGDVVRHEQVSAEVLQRVRQTLEELRPSIGSQIILYHLDENQLKQYSNEELQAMYSGH